MKHSLYKFGLFGLCLLLSFFIIKSVSAEDDVAIKIKLPDMVFHTSRLHTLNLGDVNGMSGTLHVYKDEDAGKKQLQFTNGLIVGDTRATHTLGAGVNWAVIGGGKDNTVGANYAGIGGGQLNKANFLYGLIGGGYKNEANGENAVVVGGNGNKAGANSVVVGGNSNEGTGGGVVLGGKDNDAYNNSLALGHNAIGRQNSFAWNGEAGSNHGIIMAESGILVGTTSPLTGVNLVVNGGVKVVGTNDNEKKFKGEIRYVGGCFYAFDGEKWHIINRGTEKTENDDDIANNKCKGFNTDIVAQHCEFGNTVVWHNDTVEAFANSHVVSPATCKRETLICKNGHLMTGGVIADNYYAYCYQIQK